MTKQDTKKMNIDWRRAGITLVEYNARWCLIMDTFYIGWISAEQASAEIAKLTSMLVWR